MGKANTKHISVQTRQEADVWLEMSRCIARSVGDCMERQGLDRNALAQKMGVSVQYVGRLLSGTANLSLKSVARIESALGIRCFTMTSDDSSADKQ